MVEQGMARKGGAASRQAASGERKRIPFGSARSKMTVPQRAGFQRHFFNDVGSRIREALDAGWDFVEDQEKKLAVGDGPVTANTNIGTAVSMVTGTDPQGKPQVTYLMEIREDWYHEDQEKKLESLHKSTKTIANGGFGLPASDGGYVPAGGINIRQT